MIEFRKLEATPDPSGGYLAGSVSFNNPQIYTSIPKLENQRYNLGLDKYSTTLSKLTEKDKEDEVKKLEKIRKEIENSLNINLNQDTEEGKKFLSEYVLNLSEMSELNPKNSPEDNLKYHIIMANLDKDDFPISKDADSLKSTHSSLAPNHFYIFDSEKDLHQKISKTQERNKCILAIQEMYDKDVIKLREFAGILLPNKISVNKDTTKEYLFEQLNAYLDGDLSSRVNKGDIYKQFLSFYSLEREDIKFKYYATKCMQSLIIGKDENGKFYNKKSGFKYGLKEEDIIREWKDVSNQSELGLGKTTDSPTSIKAQLKQKNFI
jgi:hypothetical protein